MIQFREKAERTEGQTDRRTDGRTDDTEFIRPHYRGSKKKKKNNEEVKNYFLHICWLINIVP